MSAASRLNFVFAMSALLTPLLAQDPERPVSRPGGPPPESPPALPAGMTEAEMWVPPTEEDWQKPVLIEFERTWADAVAVAQETKKPIMICINMDGEIASEHYAGVKYRDPEYAKLFEDYVCVVASVYRHTPRDYDEQGRRIPCPRLGCVTCGEHIAIEPFLYERFLDGVRISPRHIMVELDGKETFDIYHAWDLDSVFTTIREGIAQRTDAPEPVVKGDRTILERVGSRAHADRIAVERAYLEGSRRLREQLLAEAQKNTDAAPVDLLRLSVFGLDEELASSARDTLAEVDDQRAVGLIGEALTVPVEDSQREKLVDALERLGQDSAKARLLANVHRGLTTKSDAVDVKGWSTAMVGGGTYAPPGREELLARADAEAAAARDRRNDPAAQLELAETALHLALDPEAQAAAMADVRQGRRYLRLMFEDAREQARRAEAAGATGWRPKAVLALCAWNLGERAEALELAVQAADGMPPDPSSKVAVLTLALFAQARQEAIWARLRQKADWPREWMTDVNSAYSVLARHELGTDQHAVTHYDFLHSLGAKGRAAAVLQQGMKRFPDSWKLHDRLRARVLAEKGADALEAVYERMLQASDASALLPWHAGLTSIVAAEFSRRSGDLESAEPAYDRAVAHFERMIAVRPDTKNSSDHYVAMALAGKARLAIEREDLSRALELLLLGIARHPEATDNLDGLNISPAMTAKTLRELLVGEKRTADIARLDAALAELDPVLLEEPVFERPTRGRQRGRRRR